jgi:DNA-binding transcriptional LysR family regulator
VLLKRGRRGVGLTAVGESLLHHARIIMHDVDALRGDLAAYASGVRASVQLLATTSGLSEHLPKALAAFLREYPDISVDVEERESTDIAAAIASGAADLGFAAEHALPDNLERFLFSEDRLMLMATLRGEFAGRRQIDFQDLADRDFVGLTSSTALQAHISRHAARLGVRLRFRARLRDFDAICQMVAAGVGIAVVPEAAARRCDRVQRAGLDMRQQHRQIEEGHLHLLAEQIVDGRRRAAIGHVDDVDLRRQLEEFAGKMRQAANAGGGKIELAGLRFRKRDEFGHVLGGNVACNDEHLRHGHDQRDGREILSDLVGDFSIVGLMARALALTIPMV